MITVNRTFILSVSALIMFTGCSSKLVFVSDRDGNRQLYNMEISDSGSASTSVDLISHNPAYNDGFPDLSPDTAKLAYASTRPSQTVIATRDLTDTAGTSEQVLYGSASQHLVRPRWSRQQDRIAWAQRTQGSEDAKIMVMRADGSGTPLQLASPGSYAGHDWVFDGNLILFSSRIAGTPGSHYGLSLAKADGSGTVIGPFAEGELPVTSHDGSMIAYVQRTQLGAGTAERVVVANSRNFAVAHQFSLQPATGGRKIAAIGFTGNDEGLYIATDVASVAPTPGTGRYELFRTRLDGSNKVRLTDNTAYDSQPDGIPDDPVPLCRRCAEIPAEPETPPTQSLSINGVQFNAALLASGSPSSIAVTDYCLPNDGGRREVKVSWSGSDTGSGRFASIEFPAALFGDGPSSVEVTGCHTHMQGLQLKAYDKNGNLLDDVQHTLGQGTPQVLGLGGGSIARIDIIGQEIGIGDVCYSP